MGLIEDAQELRNREEALARARSILTSNGFSGSSLQIVKVVPPVIKSLIDEALPYLEFDLPFVVKTFSFPEFGTYTFAEMCSTEYNLRLKEINAFACYFHIYGEPFENIILIFDDESVGFLGRKGDDFSGSSATLRRTYDGKYTEGGYKYGAFPYFPERKICGQGFTESLRNELKKYIAERGIKPHRENLEDSRKRKIDEIKQEAEKREQNHLRREQKEQRIKTIKRIALIVLCIGIPFFSGVIIENLDLIKEKDYRWWMFPLYLLLSFVGLGFWALIALIVSMI